MIIIKKKKQQPPNDLLNWRPVWGSLQSDCVCAFVSESMACAINRRIMCFINFVFNVLVMEKKLVTCTGSVSTRAPSTPQLSGWKLFLRLWPLLPRPPGPWWQGTVESGECCLLQEWRSDDDYFLLPPNSNNVSRIKPVVVSPVPLGWVSGSRGKRCGWVRMGASCLEACCMRLFVLYGMIYVGPPRKRDDASQEGFPLTTFFQCGIYLTQRDKYLSLWNERE